MKKAFSLFCFVITLNLSYAGYTSSPVLTGPKPIRNFVLPKNTIGGSFCEAAIEWRDSLALFTDAIDLAIGGFTDQQGMDFINYLDSAGVAATASHYSITQSLVQDIYDHRKSAGRSLWRLWNYMYAADTVSISQLSAVLDSAATCVWEHGLTIEARMYPGPCEVAQENCLDAAWNDYVDGLIECGVGGLSFTLVTGGIGAIIGGIGGVGCITWKYRKLGRAENSCWRAYVACKGNESN